MQCEFRDVRSGRLTIRTVIVVACCAWGLVALIHTLSLVIQVREAHPLAPSIMTIAEEYPFSALLCREFNWIYTTKGLGAEAPRDLPALVKAVEPGMRLVRNTGRPRIRCAVSSSSSVGVVTTSAPTPFSDWQSRPEMYYRPVPGQLALGYMHQAAKFAQQPKCAQFCSSVRSLMRDAGLPMSDMDKLYTKLGEKRSLPVYAQMLNETEPFSTDVRRLLAE